MDLDKQQMDMADKKIQQKMESLNKWYIELQEISIALNRLSREYQISFEQFLVLEQIYQEKRNTPKELAEIFNTSGPAVSRKLNSLQEKGLIFKVRGEQLDQRITVLEISLKGITIYRKLKKDIAEWITLSKEKDIPFDSLARFLENVVL